MNALHYIGFDVHKKTISFCVKTAAGEIVEEGSVPGISSRCLNARGTLFTIQNALPLFNEFADFTNRFVWYQSRWV